MNVKATLRVRSADQYSLPDPLDLERAAHLLRESGFQVLRVGRAGINVEADALVFQRELGVTPNGGRMVEKLSPRNKKISDLVDLLEVTGKPIQF